MSDEELKLYRVVLRGMKGAIPISYGISYVVALTPTEAYGKVRDFLNKNNIGFTDDRRLEAIELIATNKQYGENEHLLFL